MSSELEDALVALEKVASRKGRPGHFQARDVLLALGRHLEEDEEAAGGAAERARRAAARLGEAWKRAVESELTLAVAEFVRAVDPRYLDLPNYDHDYTRASRQRLGWRLDAARAFALRPTARELELLGYADGVWSEAQRRRGWGPGDAGGCSEGRTPSPGGELDSSA
jgi:hypothetical protein